MPYYQYTEFTAQSRLVSALMGMYAILEKTPEDTRIDITPFTVFMAFSIESYLNSIGNRKVDYWNQIERISWKKKIEILHVIGKKKPVWGEDPLQFINYLFTLRDKLAHGKPEKIRSEPFQTLTEVQNIDPSYQYQPTWYEKLDREWAFSAKEKFRIAMQYLGSLHGFHESDYLHHSSGGVEVVEDEEHA